MTPAPIPTPRGYDTYEMLAADARSRLAGSMALDPALEQLAELGGDLTAAQTLWGHL